MSQSLMKLFKEIMITKSNLIQIYQLLTFSIEPYISSLTLLFTILYFEPFVCVTANCLFDSLPSKVCRLNNYFCEISLDTKFDLFNLQFLSPNRICFRLIILLCLKYLHTKVVTVLSKNIGCWNHLLNVSF